MRRNGNDARLDLHDQTLAVAHDLAAVRLRAQNLRLEHREQIAASADAAAPVEIEAQPRHNRAVVYIIVGIAFFFLRRYMAFHAPFSQCFVPVAEADDRHPVVVAVMHDRLHPFAVIHRTTSIPSIIPDVEGGVRGENITKFHSKIA